MPTRFEYLSILSKKIRVKIINKGADKKAPFLIFLHEGLGSIEAWSDFPDVLSQILQCNSIIYDRHGYGKSERLHDRFSNNFLHHEAINVLPDLIAKLNITNFILIGHSDGASISLIYSALLDSSVSPLAVISIAAHVVVEDITISGINEIKNKYYNSKLRDKLKAAHSNDIDHLFSNWTDIWLSDNFRNWNITKELSNIRCPILAIQGSDDRFGSSLQLDIIRNNTDLCMIRVVPGARHSPHTERRESTISAIMDFINVYKVLGESLQFPTTNLV